MLDLDLDRKAQPPRDAATLMLLREGAAGVEVFCVERNKKSGFLGGAVVFPGGKLDPGDAAPTWRALTTAPRSPASPLAPDEDTWRALLVAACRESLEEAAMLPLDGGSVTEQELCDLRVRMKGAPDALREFLVARGLRLDLGALVPFARWVTPVAEARRFDTRFFLAAEGASHAGRHDDHETMASFWARPADVLARFARREIQLAPPTHRTLEIFRDVPSVDAAFALAARLPLDPICPELVRQGETLALTLPGDPAHALTSPRLPGRSRFVLRDERWVPEDPPVS